MNSIIKMNEVSKAFKREYVLKNVNLQIRQGDIYGLLGANGAGKSTLMKILVGMIRTYSGEILFNGHVLLEDDYQYIGSLIEHPALYNRLTIYDNLKIFCLENKLPLSNIDETCRLLNIDYLNKKYESCSLGMKERSGIALALLKKPSFLILDEPFNGLDPYGIQELKEVLKLLNQNGTSILISDHIFSNLEGIVNSIGILSDKSIVYQGEVNDDTSIEKLFFEYTK